jgi:adenosylmethionine-8-amino-7-oxononanoate aminotransferase
VSSSPLWHPFTQHAIAAPEIFVERAEGAYLYTKDKRKIIDGISSWWVNTHGHCHPKIVKAVQEQAATLEQVIFAGFTHEPAERLAEKLLRVAPQGLTRVFYSDSGSTAVEVALKMSVGYWQNKGTPRHKIVALEDGYHGDTFGAMAVGARSVFSASYEPLLFDVERLPFPRAGAEEKTVHAFETLLKKEAKTIAALILEPLLLGAGGMKMYSAATLKALHDLCQKYDVHLIADEVLTGWGRTGTRFACEQAGITPDILCTSKGLTGGFLPLGATLAREEIYQAFYDKDRRKTFFHSSSFTGNPLACAAACASITIWEEEPVQARIHSIAAFHKEALSRFAARSDVENARSLGTVAALDIKVKDEGYLAEIGPALYRFFLSRNVLLRPLGNTIYVLPPYCVSMDDLKTIYDTIEDALNTYASPQRKSAA